MSWEEIFSQFHWSFCVLWMRWTDALFRGRCNSFSNVERLSFKWFSTLRMCEQHANVCVSRCWAHSLQRRSTLIFIWIKQNCLTFSSKIISDMCCVCGIGFQTVLKQMKSNLRILWKKNEHFYQTNWNVFWTNPLIFLVRFSLKVLHHTLNENNLPVWVDFNHMFRSFNSTSFFWLELLFVCVCVCNIYYDFFN